MRYLKSYCAVNPVQYKAACKRTRDILGPPDQISSRIYNLTGDHVGGSNIRRWMEQRSLPIEILAVIQSLTHGQVKITDFLPWLKNFVQ